MTVPLKTRILLADDHPMVCRGLRMVLDAEPDLTVVAEAGDGRGIDGERDAGAGLAGMQERALHIGGRLRVHPAPGGGTEVVLDVPVPERAE